jgi:hypothetical protein
MWEDRVSNAPMGESSSMAGGKMWMLGLRMALLRDNSGNVQK